MPITYRYIEAYNYFDTVFTGVVTDRDILELITNIRKEPRFLAGANELVRPEKLVSLSVSPDTFIIDAPAKELLQDPRMKNKKIAIAATEKYFYGYGRMYQTACEPTTWDIELFETVAEAEQWIKHHGGKP